MNRFEMGERTVGPEIEGLDRRSDVEDFDPRDDEREDGDRPPRPGTPRDFPIRLPGYRELDTRVFRREEG